MSQQKAQTVSPSYFYFLIKEITIRDGGNCATLGLFTLFTLFTLIKVFTLLTLLALLTLL